MTRLLCPVCGEVVAEVDAGVGMEPVEPPILIRARCRNRNAGRCCRPLLVWRITRRGRVERVRLVPLDRPALARVG